MATTLCTDWIPITVDALPCSSWINVAITDPFSCTIWKGIDVCLCTEVIQTVSTDTTLTTEPDFIICTAPSANITITLPSAAGNAGKKFTFKRNDQTQYSITVAPLGGQTIDNLLNQVLVAIYEKYTIISDGSNWLIYAG